MIRERTGGPHISPGAARADPAYVVDTNTPTRLIVPDIGGGPAVIAVSSAITLFPHKHFCQLPGEGLFSTATPPVLNDSRVESAYDPFGIRISIEKRIKSAVRATPSLFLMIVAELATVL
jgi:hypothetical protein